MTIEGFDFIAAAQRELDAYDAAAGLVRVRDRRKRAGPSLVFSVRLDLSEIEALERRAAVVGLRPSVLARNLIRVGLSCGGTAELSDALDRLESTVAELRALVP